MNNTLFLETLEQPERLHRISYEELKTLVVQYPYCQNLRWMLWQKSLSENRTDEPRHCQMMATYAFNRTAMYKQQLETNKKTYDVLPPLEVRNGVLVLQPLSLRATPAQPLPVQQTTPVPPAFQLAASLQTPPATSVESAPSAEPAAAPNAAPGENQPLLSSFEAYMAAVLADLPPSTETEPAPTNDIEPTSGIQDAVSVENDAPQDSWLDLFADMPPAIAPQDIPFEAEIGRGDPPPPASVPGHFSTWLKQFGSASSVLEPHLNSEPVKFDWAQYDEAPLTDPIAHAEPVIIQDAVQIVTEHSAPTSELPELSLQPPAAENNPASLHPASVDPVHDIQLTVEQEQIAGVTVSANDDLLARIFEAEASQYDDDDDVDVEMPHLEPSEDGPGLKPDPEAVKSVLQSNVSIATETLASIYEKQGLYDKAIEIYQRLSLAVPEKSPFFAQKIEFLLRLKG
jgi:hypothetical protein